MKKSCLIDDLEIGMIVAEEVVIADGLIVIKAGVKLDANIIEIFRKFKQSSIEIEEFIEQNASLTDEELQKLKADIAQKKKSLFKDCLEDIYMKELFRVVCDMQFGESLDG